MNRGYYNEPNRGPRGGYEPGNETWGRDSEWSGGGGQNLDRNRDQGQYGGRMQANFDDNRRGRDYGSGPAFDEGFRGQGYSTGGNYYNDFDDRRGSDFGQRGYGNESFRQQGYRGSDFDRGGYGRFSGGQDWRSDEMRGQGYPGVDYSGWNRNTGYEQARGGFGGRGTGSTGPYGQDESETRRAIAGGYPDIIPGQNQFGPHAGKGPRGYQRTDDRIREDVSECLTHHGGIDATEIEIEVRGGEVTLKGTVEDRRQKRMAEEAVENLSGVKDIHNQLRVTQGTPTGMGTQSMTSTTGQRSETATGTPTTRNNETAGVRGR